MVNWNRYKIDIQLAIFIWIEYLAFGIWLGLIVGEIKESKFLGHSHKHENKAIQYHKDD